MFNDVVSLILLFFNIFCGCYLLGIWMGIVNIRCEEDWYKEEGLVIYWVFFNYLLLFLGDNYMVFRFDIFRFIDEFSCGDCIMDDFVFEGIYWGKMSWFVGFFN